MSSRRQPTIALALFSILAVSACSEESAPFEESPVLQAATAPGPNIMAVQNRHTPELMSREGIVGTGIRRAANGEEAIVVYAVSPAHAAAAKVPPGLEGFDVEVVVTGRIDAVDYNDPQTRQRPAPNGFSVGHYAITAGTIGARVKKANGAVYILSNNHVLANSNNASVGDAILQPGAYDGGTTADQIGTLAEWQTIVMGGASNTMDAAIALVNGGDLLGTTPTWAYGAPSATTKTAALNMAVQKFGRTTGHTHGTVSEVNVTVSVCYVPLGFFGCKEAATFTGQVGITPGTFSAGGDSGSLIVTDDAGKNPVGLLFAGSSARTLANPIGPVLSRFGVTIDTGSGSPPPPADATAPTAGFNYSCRGAKCTFVDQSTDNVGVVGWSWSFGDGKSSALQNPVNTYSAAGSFNVTLVARDQAGNQSAPASRTVSCTKSGKKVACS